MVTTAVRSTPNSIRFVTSAAARCFLGVILLFISMATSAAAPPTVEQVDRVLDIAVKAGENGLVELSQQAVRRALSYGPPRDGSDRADYDIPIFGARVDTSRPVPLTPAERMHIRVPEVIDRFLPVWQKASSPNDVFETMRAVVLPIHRPHGVYFYARTQPAVRHRLRLPAVDSLLPVLLQAARDANQLSGLIEHVNSRRRSVGQQLLLLHCLMQMESTKPSEIEAASESLTELLSRAGTAIELLMAAHLGVELRQQNREASAANVLAAVASTQQSPSRRLQAEASAAVILLAAQAAFDADRSEEAIELLATLLPTAAEREDPDSAMLAAIRERAAIRAVVDRRIDPSHQWTQHPNAASEVRDRLMQRSGAEFQEPRMPPLVTDVRVEVVASNEAHAAPSDPADAGKIWLCELDTVRQQSRILLRLPDFSYVNGPTLSPDQSRIAFEATRPNEAITSGRRIYVVRLATGECGQLSPGYGASWSPTEDRILLNRLSPFRGTWVIDADGRGADLVNAEAQSAAWLGHAQRVLCLKSTGQQAVLSTHSLADDGFGQSQTLPVRLSPSLETAPGRAAFAVADSGESMFRIMLTSETTADSALIMEWQKVVDSEMIHADVSVSPSSGRIAISRKSSAAATEQIYLLSDRDDSPVLAAGQRPDRRNRGLCWRADSERLIYISSPMK